MRRKSTAPSPKSGARSIIKEFLGEETASTTDEDVSFHSPSTDAGATRYSLDFTTANPSKQYKSTLSTKAAQKDPKTQPELKKTSVSRSQEHEGSDRDEDDSDINVEDNGTTPRTIAIRKSLRIQNVSTSSGKSNISKTLPESTIRRTSRSQQHEDSTSDEDEERFPTGRGQKVADQIQTTRRASPRKSDVSSRPGTSRSPTKRSLPATSKKSATAPKLKAYKKIRSIQDSKTLAIKKLPFSRVIREFLMKYDRGGLHITPQALAALQESAEIYLTILFQDANRCTIHRDRVTLHPKDIQLVRYLRGPQDPGN